MKIKVHSSFKNIKSMVQCGITLENAIELAASTIIDAQLARGEDSSITFACNWVDPIYGGNWYLDSAQYTIIER